MQSKIIIFFALMAVVFATDKPVEETAEQKIENKSDDKSLDTKKDKRGLWDLGYGINTYGAYGINSGIGLTSYSSYSDLPVQNYYPTNTHTVITKEVAVPIEKHIPVAVKVPYAVPVDRPYPVHVPVEVTRHVPYPVDRPYAVRVPYPVPVVKHVAYSSPVVVQKNSGWSPSSPAFSYSSSSSW